MQLFLLSIVAVFLSLSSKAWACSSCGSGGADPVILNPSEQQKLYLGIGLQNRFQEIDSAAKVRESDGPDRKWLGEVAFARRITSDLFASLVLDFGFNQHGDQQQNGQGDISANLRYTFLQASLLDEALPQIQVIASHRFARGRSVYNSQKEFYLDVFGGGYDETYLGVDVWWGMLPILSGFSYLYGVPQATATTDGTILQGHLQRLIVTSGVLVSPEAKVLVGLILNRREAGRQDGVELDHSERQSQDIFLTFETLHPESANLRFGLTRKAALGDNRNADRCWSVTAAWMHNL